MSWYSFRHLYRSVHHTRHLRVSYRTPMNARRHIALFSTRMCMLIVVVLISTITGCSKNTTRQTPVLGQSRTVMEHEFRNVQKTDLAWFLPSREWGRDGVWEVRFDEFGLAIDATWHMKKTTPGFNYASYIHILRESLKDFGDGSNDTPTGETFNTWRVGEYRYILDLASDSSALYFRKSLMRDVMAGG
jgi:hypothetical protein